MTSWRGRLLMTDALLLVFREFIRSRRGSPEVLQDSRHQTGRVRRGMGYRVMECAGVPFFVVLRRGMLR